MHKNVQLNFIKQCTLKNTTLQIFVKLMGWFIVYGIMEFLYLCRGIDALPLNAEIWIK